MDMLKIREPTDNPVVNLALDTIHREKQALIFVNTKRGAEAEAERIAKKLKADDRVLLELSTKILHELSTPTRQCRRLAKCIKKGIAFHHSGLASGQRKLIEDHFRTGEIKIICSTPTLCLAKGTKVWHAMQETEIQNLDVEHPIYVLTKKRIIQEKPQKIETKINEHHLLSITSSSGYAITLTSNHKLLVKRKGKELIKCAHEIVNSDKIATLGRITLEPTGDPKFSDFIHKNSMTIKDGKIPESMFYLIGVMLGVEDAPARKRETEPGCKVSGLYQEMLYALKKACDNHKLDYQISTNDDGTHLMTIANSAWFTEFLSNCGIIDKIEHIDEKLMLANKQSIRSLLQGLYDAGGSIEQERLSLRLRQASLLRTIQKLLLRFGIVARLQENSARTSTLSRHKQKTLQLHELHIVSTHSLAMFHEQINFTVSKKKKDLEEMMKTPKTGAGDHDGDIFWDSINKIELVPVAEHQEVYDVILADGSEHSHLFVAEGFFVHNSFGMNLPAFRAIIRDLKRYGGRWGMQWIPSLEYHQMIGRAGRPDFNDSHGEALCFSSTQAEAEEIKQKYLFSLPEKIYSKLAAEPVLRTYILSLIAAGFVQDKKGLLAFLDETFYAHHMDSSEELNRIMEKMIGHLKEWDFIKTSREDFTSADDLGNERLRSTALGQRVAELYLDPYTAQFLITCMQRAAQKQTDAFSFLSMATNTLELRPGFTVRKGELPEIEERLTEHSSSLIIYEPSIFDMEYDPFLKGIKTAFVLQDWLCEKHEDYFLEHYHVRPGEFKVKKDRAYWVLYAAEELAKILEIRQIGSAIRKIRMRLEHGVKEELLTLIRLKGIGRARARKLFMSGMRSLGDIKGTDITTLSRILGKKTAQKVKRQLGGKIK